MGDGFSVERYDYVANGKTVEEFPVKVARLGLESMHILQGK